MAGPPAARPAAPEPGSRPSPQERLEATRLGRALISAFLAVTVACLVATNLPRSGVRRDVMRAAGPYLNATGLDQSWALFAPEPRGFTIGLRARLRYADGTVDTWRPPAGTALLGNYWDYHWQKWQEWVLDAGHRRLWRPAAEFVARERARAGRRPTRVTLIRLTTPNNPPGRGPDHGPVLWRPYYTLAIADAALARARTP